MISKTQSIFGIDPGTNAMGVALVDPFGKLIAVGCIKRPAKLRTGTDPIIVAKGMAGLVWDWCIENSSIRARIDSQLVIERQAIYPKEQQKADPMDILKLAYLTGALGPYFDEIKSYEPRQWKGQTPKEAVEARLKKRLSPEEWALVEAIPRGIRDNAVEAAAIIYKYRDAC